MIPLLGNGTKESTISVEDADRRVLQILQRDGRISNQDLAAEAGLSNSACWRRVRALEAAGVIRGYAARLDAGQLGLGFHAMVHVHLTRHAGDTVDGFVTAIRARAEVLDCFATTGEADYHLRVMCADLDAYNRFLDVLFQLPGVASARTNLVLREIKQDGALPI
ncbi:MAG: Lrp/AsnC family transcriptional regulator [Pseudomonadota bacterium]